jgi:hypothetical protein
MSQAGQDHLYKKVELAGPGVDPYTGCQGYISEPHLLTHQGKMFHTTLKLTGLIDAAVASILIRPPAGAYTHIHKTRTSVGSGDVDIISYENAAVSADGTPVLVHNTNRASSILPQTEIFSAPTITDPGDPIHALWIPPTGAGLGMSQQGLAGAEMGEEWILVPEVNYIHQITNNSGDTISVWFEFLFYEL